MEMTVYGQTLIINGLIIELTFVQKISPHPSLPKRGLNPPFGKGRLGGIL